MSIKVLNSVSLIAVTRAQLAALAAKNAVGKNSLYFIADENKLAVGTGVATTVETSTLTLNVPALAITSANATAVLENAPFSLPLTASQTVTWAITGGADSSKFTLTGSTLSMVARDFENPVDSNTDNVYTVVVQATNTSGTSVTQTINITVSNALEGVLAPSTANYDASSASGSTIATVIGLDIGANETLSSIVPNDGRLALASGNRIVSGLSALSGGVLNATVTTSAGRTLSLAITVTAPADIFPAITQTTATIDDTAAAESVVIDMPALATDEKRYFIPASCPAFPIAVGTSGKLLRGLTRWATGSVGTGTIRQDINGTIKNTNVTITTTAASLSTGSGPDSNRYMFAATRIAVPAFLYTVADSGLSRLSRMSMTSPDYAIRNIRGAFVNTYFDHTGGSIPEIDVPNSLTLDFVTLEVGGQFYPVTFNGGQTSVTLAPGASIIHDPVMNGASPLIIPARTQYWYRTSDSHLSGQSRPGGMSRQSQYGDGIEYTAAPQTSKATAGTVSLLNVLGNAVYGPCAVVAQGWDGRPVVWMLGDSLTAGANDGTTFYEQSGCAGYVARGLDLETGGRMPHLNWALTGSRASQCSTRNAGQFRRRAEIMDKLKALNSGTDPFTTIYSGYIVNDVGNGTAGTTATQLKTTLQTWWNFLKTEYPNTRLGQASAMPRTSDSNNGAYSSFADQLVATNNDRSATPNTADSQPRWTTSDWMMTKPAPLDFVIDVAAHVADGAKWRNRSFQTTVAVDSTANSTVQFVDKPTRGELVVLNPGQSNKIATIVTGVTGTGPYTVTFFVAPSVAVTAGTIVRAAPTSDGVHPTPLIHIEEAVATTAVAKTAGLFGTTVTGSPITITHTFDPAAGTPKTFAANWSELPDVPNVVVLLKAGNHGAATITGARTNKITVVGEAGAICGKTVHQSSSRRWTYIGVKFTDRNPGYDQSPKVFQNNNTTPQHITAIFYTDSTTSEIEVNRCTFCAAEDARTWIDIEWAYYCRLNAIKLQGQYSKILNCSFYNNMNAISVGGVKIAGVAPTDYVIENNYIQDNSIDYIQHAGDNIVIRGNTLRLSRHTPLNGGNAAGQQNLHADFIHGYGDGNTTSGNYFYTVYKNVLIENNDCDEGPYSTKGVQGINVFDGSWPNYTVRNNKIRCNAFHGIAVKGGIDVLIENNDLDKIPVSANTSIATPWILVTFTPYDEGARPPERVKVKNNKAPQLMMLDPGVYVWPFAGGTGYTAAGTTITLGAPTQSPFAQAAVNQKIMSGTSFSRFTMSNRGADRVGGASYTEAPSITVNGDGTGADLRVCFTKPDYFMEGGVSQIIGNVKQDGTALSTQWIDYSP